MPKIGVRIGVELDIDAGVGYHVCGTTPGYLALKLMGNVHGQEMAYQSCPADDHNTSAVTVAGVAFL